jgi:HAD superfamily hydrolase (TIGR01549 family)
MPARPSLRDFQAVLFDVDGTLIDSLFWITQGLGDSIFKFCEFQPEASEIRKLVGLPLLKQMAMFAKHPNQVQEMSDYAIERMKFHRRHEKHFDGAVECLKLCHDHGIKTALVTSKNSDEFAAFFPSFPYRSSVDAAVCAGDVSQPKPSPESAYLACDRLGVSPTHCAFVGDSIYDMRCGRSAGMTCIAVSYGASNRLELEAEQPNLLFTSPEELLSWASQSLTSKSCHERK